MNFGENKGTRGYNRGGNGGWGEATGKLKGNLGRNGRIWGSREFGGDLREKKSENGSLLPFYGESNPGIETERGVKSETWRQIYAFENAFGDRNGILGRTAGQKWDIRGNSMGSVETQSGTEGA